ncbi:Uncharacterised protein [uncultured archaeon]|nr:Uncharacterised protein [uncultured archaeon]
MKWELIVLLIFLVACAKPAVQPASKSDMLDITKAVQLGKPIKCVSEQSGQTVTIYMKGSQMRMDTLPADAHGIYTEDAMYTWQGRQGTIMKMEDVKRMSAEAGQQYKPKTQEEVIENAKKVNSKCEPAEVAEAMFVPPSDVQFQDVGEMIKQIEGMTKTLQK